MKALDRAIQAAGGVTALAKHLRVHQSTVSQWKRRGSIPARAVLKIEQHTGVSRYDLCPDVYGKRPERVPA